MSIWEQIRSAFSEIRASGFVAFLRKLRGDGNRSIAFTIAVVALGAKMAKADGLVTHDEVVAFREVFRAEASAEADIARLFNLARQDIAGYEVYARQVKRLFPDPDHMIVANLIEGLFYIAMADGHYHDGEDVYLSRVAEILGIPPQTFRAIRARAVPGHQGDPYDVLGVAPDSQLDTIRAAWKKLVRECHPDVLQHRGLPPEAIGISERRLVAVNEAWRKIQAEREAA